jgi:propionyl-CoA synthetase
VASIDADGNVHLGGREDDVINVSGHRLACSDLEAAVQGFPNVVECAVIGALDPVKGTVPVALAVLSSGGDDAAGRAAACAGIVARVRAEIGAVAGLHRVHIVKRLPKTRSGKVLRATMRAIIDGSPNVIVPATIEDAAVLDEIRSVVEAD